MLYNLAEFKEWMDKKSLDSYQKKQWKENFANLQKEPDLWEAATRGIANGGLFSDYGKFLKAWQEEVDSRIGRVKELKNQLTQSQSKITQLEKELIQAKKLNNLLTPTLQVRDRELKETKDLNTKLQADNKDLLKDIQNYKQKISSQEQKITNLETQQLTDNEKQIINKLKEICAIDQESLTREERVEKFQAKLAEYQALDLDDSPHLFEIPSKAGYAIEVALSAIETIKASCRQEITLIKEVLRA